MRSLTASRLPTSGSPPAGAVVGGAAAAPAAAVGGASSAPRASMLPMEERGERARTLVSETLANGGLVLSYTVWESASRLLRTLFKSDPLYYAALTGQSRERRSAEAALRKLEDLHAWHADLVESVGVQRADAKARLLADRGKARRLRRSHTRFDTPPPSLDDVGAHPARSAGKRRRGGVHPPPNARAAGSLHPGSQS